MLLIPIPARRIWQRFLDNLFPARREPRRHPVRRGLRPLLEELENRLAPANFTATTGEGLRTALLSADSTVVNSNASPDTSDTITLTGSGPFLLNNTSDGALLAQNQTNGVIANKMITIVGPAVASGTAPKAIIKPDPTVSWQTRIIDVEGTGITLVLQNLAIEGGKLVSAPADTPVVAQGGGILIDGGNVTLSNVAVTGNVAQGAPGISGGPGAQGQPGAGGQNGGAAQGGGIFLASGSLTLKNATIKNNEAIGGQGGKGGAGGAGTNGDTGRFFTSATAGHNGANGSPSGNGLNGTAGHHGVSGTQGGKAGKGGDGGSGGEADGGGIYVATGQLIMTGGSLSSNQALGGAGGAGGAGGKGGVGGSGQAGGRGGDGGGGGSGQDRGASGGNGGNGGNAGSGGTGGNGGNGGTGSDGGGGGGGGDAKGGGMFVASGTVSVQSATVSSNKAIGGNGAAGGGGGAGGQGGVGGAGGEGGSAGNGGNGGSGSILGGNGGLPGLNGNAGNGGDAGDGGDGANGGDGGDGGNGFGGGFYLASGTLDLTTDTLALDLAQGGIGGAGGKGGNGGSGGNGDFGGANGGRNQFGGGGGDGGDATGSSGIGGDGMRGDNGANGGTGAKGGKGGDGKDGGKGGGGGSAFGGDVYQLQGTLDLSGGKIAGQAVGGKGGAGGPGGKGGNGGDGGPFLSIDVALGSNGGNAGNGGNGGAGALAQGGGADSGNGGKGGNGGDAGDGGDGGDGGPGGGGGDAHGGSLFIASATSFTNQEAAITGTSQGGASGIGGAVGPAGTAGIPGAAGAGGLAGAAGTGEPAGHKGHNGAKGSPGADGDAGSPGSPGLPGLPGSGFGDSSTTGVYIPITLNLQPPSPTEDVALPANQEVATFTDGAPLANPASYVVTVTWGDGSTSSTTAKPPTVTVQADPNQSGVFDILATKAKPYANAGAETFSVTVTHPGGSAVVESEPITVADQPLTLTLTQSLPQPVAGRALTNVLLGSFVDGDPTKLATNYSATVSWGDGQTSSTAAGNVTIKPVSGQPGTFQVFASTPHPYAAVGTETLTVTVTDKGGASDSHSTSITATDAGLTMTLVPPAPVEGAAVPSTGAALLVATFKDTDPTAQAAGYTVTVNWGDGETSSTADGDAVVHADPHTPGLFDVLAAKPDPYPQAAKGLTFSVTVSGNGVSATKSATINVADAPLTLTLSPPVFVKNVPISQAQVGMFLDPGSSNGDTSIYSVTVMWGDGTTSSTGAGNVTLQQDPNFPDGFDILATKPSAYAALANGLKFQITVTDEDGATTTQATKVNVAPVSLTVPPFTTTEGQAINNQLVATYTNADTTGSYSATVSWGDGTTPSPATITPDPNNADTFDVKATKPKPYSDSATPVTLTVSVTEKVQTTTYTTSASAPVTINDVDPVVTLMVPTTAVEGQALTHVLVGTFTDPGVPHAASGYSATVSWSNSAVSTTADGNVFITRVGTTDEFDIYATKRRPYAEEGTYAFSVTVTDLGGASATKSGSITVADALLKGAGVNFSAKTGQSITLPVATFQDTDPQGTLSDYTATINWGDGTAVSPDVTSGVVEVDPRGGFEVVGDGTHSYSSANKFTVTIDIKDVGGATLTLTCTATIST